jgi:hypothetical protein
MMTSLGDAVTVLKEQFVKTSKFNNKILLMTPQQERLRDDEVTLNS